MPRSSVGRRVAEPVISETAIELHEVTRTFPGAALPAVDRLSLRIERGSIVALIGPSGCGKTTTLRIINRLLEPTSGRVEIHGEDVTDRPATELRRQMGYVIQQVGLFPHRTIAQNIATVPKILGWKRQRTRERIAELAELVGLDGGMLDRYPDELSGGQQQRVGVARALAADPPILLMDEPFGAVDPIVRGRLQDELLGLQAKLHKTIVLVTHDIDEALKLADRIALMNVGGVLEQYSPPDELLRSPANEFVERFVGSERGAKRLQLATVRQLSTDDGPVVELARRVEDARAVMVDAGTDWVAVTEHGRFLGWLHVDDLDGARTVPRPEPSEASPATVRLESTLLSALEAILESPSDMVVVEDAGRLHSVVGLAEIREALTAGGDR